MVCGKDKKYQSKCRICNHVQNILNKVDESSKIGQDQKNFTPAFSNFLNTITKTLILENRLGTRLYIQPV